MRVPVPLLLALWTAAPLVPAASQDTTCTYDQCALGIHEGFWRRSLVKGSQREAIAGISLLAPPLPFLSTRTDSAGYHYRAFRSGYNSGFWLALVGGLGTVASYAVITASDGEDAVVVGTLLVSLGFTVWGGERRRRAVNELDRAIWWYNRSLRR